MAEAESKLSQNIDKIAYGVAGILGLLVLALPFLMGGAALKETAAAEQMRILGERIKEDPKVDPPPPPLKEAIDKQWEVGPASPDDPVWVVDRMPLVVRKIPKPPEETPAHTAGKITEIACGRDAEKKVPYVIVKGALGEGNQHVVLDQVVLLRREGTEELAPVPAFKASPDATFEFQDYAVEPGKMYTYALRTVAKRDPSAPEAVKALPGPDAEKTSEPLAMTSVVPFDFYLSISNFEAPTPESPPRVHGKLSYWDYKAGKLVQVKAGATVPFAEREKFDRFVFLRIEDSASKVTIRDDEKNIRYEIKSADSKQARPVACFDPVTPGGPPEPEVPAEKPKGKPKTPPKGKEKDTKGSKTKKPTTKEKDSSKTKTKPKTGTQKSTEETKPKKRSFE